MTDRDIGDMFLNFQLHESAIPFTGVNLSTLYDSPDDVGLRLAVWDRNLMGFAPSPYNSIKMAMIVEEVAKGDQRQVGKGKDGRDLNPFQWESVRLNLPGTRNYDPCVSGCLNGKRTAESLAMSSRLWTTRGLRVRTRS
jgi:hypothetical protein